MIDLGFQKERIDTIRKLKSGEIGADSPLLAKYSIDPNIFTKQTTPPAPTATTPTATVPTPAINTGGFNAGSNSYTATAPTGNTSTSTSLINNNNPYTGQNISSLNPYDKQGNLMVPQKYDAHGNPMYSNPNAPLSITPPATDTTQQNGNWIPNDNGTSGLSDTTGQLTPDQQAMIDITNQERDIQNQSAQDQLWKNADRATYQADIQTRNLNTALGRNAENQDMANQNNIDAQNRLNRDYNTELQKVQQEAEFGNSNMSSANASSGVGVTGYTRARGEYMTRVQNQIQNLQTHYGDSVANLQKTIALTNVKYSRAAEDLATQLSDVKNNLSRYLTDIQNTSLDLADRQKAIANLEALKQKYIYLSQNQAILNRAKAEADNALQKRADFLTQQTGTVWTVGDDGMLHDTGSKTLAGQNYDLNVNKAAFDQWYKTQGMAIRRAASSRRISSNTGTPASLYQQIADFAKTGNPTQQDVVNYAAYLAYKFPSKKAGKMVDMQNAVNIGNMVYGDIHQMSVSPLAPERTALNTSTTTSNNPNPPLTPQDLKQL